MKGKSAKNYFITSCLILTFLSETIGSEKFIRDTTKPPNLRFTKQPSVNHVTRNDGVTELMCGGESSDDVTIDPDWFVKPLLLDPGWSEGETVRDYKLFDGWAKSKFVKVERFTEFLNGSMTVAMESDGEKVTVKHGVNVNFAIRCSIGQDDHVIMSEEFRFTHRAGRNGKAVITSQPKNQINPSQLGAFFLVKVERCGDCKFQWMKDSEPVINFEDGKNKLRRILGTDTSFLQIYQPFDSDNGNYSCHVTNKHGTVISESAILHATNKRIYGYVSQAFQF